MGVKVVSRTSGSTCWLLAGTGKTALRGPSRAWSGVRRPTKEASGEDGPRSAVGHGVSSLGQVTSKPVKSTSPMEPLLWEVMKVPTSWVVAALGTSTVAIVFQVVPSVEYQAV